MNVNKDGLRKDTKQLFRQFTLAEPTSKPQVAPFLVVQDEVKKVRTVDELMAYPDNTKVLQTWPGKKRSDIFYFTVGDLRKEVLNGD